MTHETDGDRRARLDEIRADVTGYGRASDSSRVGYIRFLLAELERAESEITKLRNSVICVERERDTYAARMAELVLDVTAAKARAETAEAQVREYEDHPPGIGDEDIQRVFRERDEARRERDEARRKLHAWQHATPIIQERDAARARAAELEDALLEHAYAPDGDEPPHERCWCHDVEEGKHDARCLRSRAALAPRAPGPKDGAT